ncbi:transcriptional regulator [Pseudohoeflea suaedae]|uniref:Transcriptional regulator n=1 Tax=Pseudohoeflea suaedae TaxID=877384 RepID=A0A4R5PI03_9HYPH|nr:helix-turn-helix domain-containing protein [Pseudohoeflea suaedae]TDH34849.1 transcriptional regulator [Pseudohoeflea suaedae]
MTTFRSGCPITSSLDIVGDKWTLVILRSMAMGATSFAELIALPEKIATNILASRLGRMEETGLIVCDQAGQGRRRGVYRLTRKGADLLPVVQALARWGETHLPDRWTVPEKFRDMTSEQLIG